MIIFGGRKQKTLRRQRPISFKGYYLKMKNINKIGIGNDIESVGRFAQLDKEEHRPFFEKVFTDEESNGCFLNRFSASF